MSGITVKGTYSQKAPKRLFRLKSKKHYLPELRTANPRQRKRPTVLPGLAFTYKNAAYSDFKAGIKTFASRTIT